MERRDFNGLAESLGRHAGLVIRLGNCFCRLSNLSFRAYKVNEPNPIRLSVLAINKPLQWRNGRRGERAAQ
ncbi:hypothetical protein PAMC26510_09365 [Caballeronia sordidicola]|uniref:Uncharacterized protein n=1 Tax=Caballeronia sordidicola TaxID=196367 RepID=A0A242N1F3_CABSO|nr:hypothetical protein PAMC26510_09365 [Caballeronia sordidicola]